MFRKVCGSVDDDALRKNVDIVEYANSAFRYPPVEVAQRAKCACIMGVGTLADLLWSGSHSISRRDEKVYSGCLVGGYSHQRELLFEKQFSLGSITNTPRLNGVLQY